MAFWIGGVGVRRVALSCNIRLFAPYFATRYHRLTRSAAIMYLSKS
jgi:hypothetical protein